ncbi:MAG: hypothetical protein CML73_04660 [Rhodobiaceae bacterium]|nr:hypothetical protein [Rhodobiaceae bacterium]
MRLLYFTVSIPVLFMSCILLFLNPRLRHEYQLVKFAIAIQPQAEFEKLLTYLLVLAEDHRYKAHFGFDPIAIGRAIFRFVLSSRIEGASTIEQQLVRTITRKYEITLQRKIEEITISSMISINNTKEDIAHTYLSLAYFGSNVIGYKSASKTILMDNELNDCKLKHGAAIISLLKRPKPTQKNELWSKRHKERTSYILAKYNAPTSRSNRTLS